MVGKPSSMEDGRRRWMDLWGNVDEEVLMGLEGRLLRYFHLDYLCLWGLLMSIHKEHPASFQISWLMQITMGTTATETLSVAGNIFVSQVGIAASCPQGRWGPCLPRALLPSSEEPIKPPTRVTRVLEMLLWGIHSVPGSSQRG